MNPFHRRNRGATALFAGFALLISGPTIADAFAFTLLSVGAEHPLFGVPLIILKYATPVIGVYFMVLGFLAVKEQTPNDKRN